MVRLFYFSVLSQNHAGSRHIILLHVNCLCVRVSLCTPYPLFHSQMLLRELNLGHHKYEFSSLAVSLSLEGKASHRELTSRLLRDLVGKVLSESDMARAFDKILKELPDLMLDTPEAPQVLDWGKIHWLHHK